MEMRYIEEGRGKTGVYAALLFMLALGVTAGCAYLVKNWDSVGNAVTEYLQAVFSPDAVHESGTVVFKSSFASNLITFAVIFFMGFFRFGFLVTGAVIIRKGFITGFTAASFIRAYGAKGITAMLSASPSMLITVPAVVILSAVSVIFSRNENKFQKKYIFSYIFFGIFMIAIFCAASFSDGFLTTIFMNRVFPEIS